MSLPPEIQALLKNQPLFSGIQNDLLLRHFGHSRRILAANQTLSSLEDPRDSMYLILSGCLRANLNNQADIPSFGAGEAVSRHSLPDAEHAFDQLIAVIDCELLCVDFNTLSALAADSPQAADNMMGLLAAGITLGRRGNHHVENKNGYASLNFVDEVTGLYNGQWMFKTFERQINRSILTTDPAVLMLVSIDHFARYNLSNGNLGGDQALRTIAQTILSCLRPNDQAAHYYGEVFAVFLPHTTLEEAGIASKRLLAQVARTDIVTPNGDALPPVTVSIGMAAVQGGVTLQHLINEADEAMRNKSQAS